MESLSEKIAEAERAAMVNQQVAIESDAVAGGNDPLEREGFPQTIVQTIGDFERDIAPVSDIVSGYDVANFL